MANPNQALIDQLRSFVAALDTAEANIDAGIKQYRDAIAAAQTSVDNAKVAADAAIAGLTAQKAAYEAQEAAIRQAITALGG